MQIPHAHVASIPAYAWAFLRVFEGVHSKRLTQQVLFNGVERTDLVDSIAIRTFFDW